MTRFEVRFIGQDQVEFSTDTFSTAIDVATDKEVSTSRPIAVFSAATGEALWTSEEGFLEDMGELP